MDEKGLCTQLLSEREPASFVYTTPSHQYPMGGILPIQRRLELIRYAERNDCYIVEDDYDSEFRYEGQPVSTLYELNPQRVIYLGSFSKLLAPAIRLGFMLLPEKLRTPCKQMKMYTDVHSDAISQHVLARYIRNGGFEVHIRRMRRHYAGNRRVLLDALNQHFSGGFRVLGHASGLHLVAAFHGKAVTNDALRRMESRGVRVYRLGSYYLDEKESRDNRVILGYSHLSEKQIARGVEIIHEILV